MALKLSGLALLLWKARRGFVDPAQRAGRAALAKVCETHGYPLPSAVASFEASYGGMLLPDEPKQKDGPAWLFGAFACLSSGAHVAPSGGHKSKKLVPVVYSPNDVIYFLDEAGQAYAQDTIEDLRAVPYADNAKALVWSILLFQRAFELQGAAQEQRGLKGEQLAKTLSLSLVKEASGKHFRFFSDAKAKTLIVEDVRAKQTRLFCADQKLLKKLALSAPAKAGKAAKATKAPGTEPPAELAGAIVSLAFQKRESLPDVFDTLPDLVELDISGNKLCALPESLWRAPALKTLNANHNPLAVLSAAIGQAKKLRSLGLRDCALQTLPEALADAKNLEALFLTGCSNLDVDQAISVIARLPKLKELSLPLAASLTTFAPLAATGLQKLSLWGYLVTPPQQLPPGLGQLRSLTSLNIQYADEVASLPPAPEDVQALRLLFNKRFTDADIRKSAEVQPKKLYLAAFVKTL